MFLPGIIAVSVMKKTRSKVIAPITIFISLVNSADHPVNIIEHNSGLNL